MNQPRVSIVVPTRNSDKTLKQCLQSVTDQSYQDIELIIVDSYSTDSTKDIASKFNAKIIETKWRLLGARYLGLQASTGDYSLLLDSDQVLFPDTISRLVSGINNYDMICLEERAYNPESHLEKLFDADRRLVNNMPEIHLDPIEGVMLPRFYKSDVLKEAFTNIPIDKLHDVVAHDHAIIYYEAYKISKNVGILSNAVLHKEPSSLSELWQKNYRYGKTTKELLKTGLYVDLLKRKSRTRKGSSLNLVSIQSLLLLMLKGVPYFLGLYF